MIVDLLLINRSYHMIHWYILN